MSNCQKDAKKSNTWTMEEVHKKIDIMRFTDIDVNFDVTCESHEYWSKILYMDSLRVFGDHHVSCQN